jgi:Macrocin-O-methyltransferase (TylF)
MFLKLDEPYLSVFLYSQVNQVKQRNLVRLAKLVVKENVPGDIVECGVLDGGTAALMAWASRDASPQRRVHLFDAWEGLPETTVEDGEAAAVWTGQVVGSPRRALAIMKKLGIPDERVVVHHGWFEDTLPHIQIDLVALVHIDCANEALPGHLVPAALSRRHDPVRRLAVETDAQAAILANVSAGPSKLARHAHQLPPATGHNDPLTPHEHPRNRDLGLT